MPNEQSCYRSNELTYKAQSFLEYKTAYFQKHDKVSKKTSSEFFNATEDEWNDWNWQLKNRITTAEQLKDIFSLSSAQYMQIKNVRHKFRFAITPYYLSLIKNFNKNDPIFLQSIPQYEELCGGGKTDPMDERMTNPAGVITRRYPDRLIVNVTNCCATFCRHCQRRRNISETDENATTLCLEESFEYIKKHPEIRDVLITGGDPFTLSDDTIEKILSKIRNIDTVEIIRIGTRTPVTMPQRITHNLICILKKYTPIYINTQFNHPAEVTPESSAACISLADNGIILGNQMVFLQNVNNDYYTVQLLNQLLLKIKVRPYYIFHPKNVIGTGHFSISIAEGIKIYEQLRGNTSGLAIPTYIINAEHGLGKIPLNKEILKSADKNGNCVLETWEGKKITLNIWDTNHTVINKTEESNRESRDYN